MRCWRTIGQIKVMLYRSSNVLAVVLCIAVSVVVLGAWIFGSNISALIDRRNATTRNAVWITKQKQLIESGQVSELRFYSTIETDFLVRSFTGADEITKIVFHFSDVTDAGLSIVPSFENLHEAVLCGERFVTDRGLIALRPSINLRKLRLINVGITDEGIEVLSSYPKLEHLTLIVDHDKIRVDKVVENLRKCPSLRRFTVGGKWIATEELASLIAGMPTCSITVIQDIDDDEW
jgi:hypothetical protein